MVEKLLRRVVVKTYHLQLHEDSVFLPKNGGKVSLTFTCIGYCIGRDSSVGIATGYGLGGPGIESRWGRDYSHMSRPVLGPIQPPVQWVSGISRG
jgi:hypothetical protein